MKGPYTKSIRENIDTYIVPMHFRDQTWYRTTGVAREPLPYEVADARVDFSTFAPGDTTVSVLQAVQYCWSRGSHPSCDLSYTDVSNKAYQKFVSKMNNPIGMGTDIAEFSETFSMLKSWGDAARHPFSTFSRNFRSLGQVIRQSGNGRALSRASIRDLLHHSSKDVSRAASNLWLQFHFGVQPLYQDVFDLLDLGVEYEHREYQVDAAASGTTEADTTGYKTQYHWLYKLGVRYAATIRVTDANAALRTTLGIENPSAIAWELVPYSFLVDWFYPVSSYINSMTDFHGRQFVSGYKNKRSRGICNVVMETYNLKTHVWRKCAYTAGGFYFTRDVGAAAMPVFQVPPLHMPGKLSAVRTVTALSLILQRALGASSDRLGKQSFLPKGK